MWILYIKSALIFNIVVCDVTLSAASTPGKLKSCSRNCLIVT
jgi:hypothetical protein